MCFEKDLISHRKALRAFAFTLTRNPVAADDLTQETLCKAWRAQALPHGKSKNTPK